MVTAKPIKKYSILYLVQAKVLLDKIYQQEEVIEQLVYTLQDIQTMGDFILVNYIYTKLYFINKPNIRLGEFNPEADITKLNISALAKRV